MSEKTPEERLTKIETTLFSNNGSKGLNQKFDEFYSIWWNWHDEKRKKTCFYLVDKGADVQAKHSKITKYMLYVKEFGTLIAMIGLLLKVFKLI
jgi:hypothetical protein